MSDWISREFREAYLDSHIRSSLLCQIRAARGDLSQRQFGRKIGQKQSVVSRLENERSGAVTLRTLIKIANRLGLGLIVQFVPYDDFRENAKHLREVLEALKP